MPLIQGADDLDCFQAPGFFRSRFTQPGQGLLFVTEKGIQVGDFTRVLVAALSQFLP